MIASKRYESVWNTFLKELTRENVEPVLSLVPLVKAFALPCSSETSNAESPTPVYVYRKLS